MSDCPICLSPFDHDSQINKVTTECGHTFHCSCLMKNVARNGFGCPYCRNVMAIQPLSDDEDVESIVSVESTVFEEWENDALTSFRWFHRRLDVLLVPISQNGIITYEMDLDNDGYYHEGSFEYWDEYKEGYMHPPYLLYKLSNDGTYDDASVDYTDLAMAYLSLKRRCDGVIPLQEGDYAYRYISSRCIPVYDNCRIYKNAELKVNKMIDRAIQHYYVTDTEFEEI